MNHPLHRSDRIGEGAADLSLEADVLVIGGSLAGCWAALAARAAGADVVVVEKGHVGTAGVVAASNVGGYALAPDASEDDRRKLVEARHGAATGLDDLDHVRRVYEQSHASYTALERLGFRWDSVSNARAKFGRFIGPYTLHFLRNALQRAGVRILDHAPALELIVDADGIAGATGIERRSGRTWVVHAGAVVLATGGNAFLSGAMGTRGVVGDGHLFAAEAGAAFSGLEYSTLYGYAPKGSPSTKGFWCAHASFFDGERLPLHADAGRGGMAAVARAILETGGAHAIIDKAPDGFEAHARLNHANTFQFFDRAGIDPFRQIWPLDLLYEGHIRAVGGVVVDDDCATGVPGLFAAGDLTDRTRLTGASMSGAGPAVAWCFASGEWAGRGAHAHAARRGRGRSRDLRGLGRAGLRPSAETRTRHDSVRDGIRAEILPLTKTFFKTRAALRQSSATVEELWRRADAGLEADGPDGLLKTREAAALAFGARLQTTSSLARKESRGLHRLEDHPHLDPSLGRVFRLRGVDRFAIDDETFARAAAE